VTDVSGHKHGVSIQSSINFGDTLLQITRKWKTAETWFLARLFIYQSSIVSQILDFIHWMVTIFSFDHRLVKTENSEDICLQTLTSFSLTRAKLLVPWQKLFRPGQILYSWTNFQRDFRQVSILGFPLNFNSEALSWYSNFPPGFRMKSSIYVCMYVNLYLNTGNHQLSLS